MGQRNMHEDWAKGVNDTFQALRRKAKEANMVPLGQERLTPAEARERFTNMGPAERKAFIASQGEEAVLKIWRGA